MDFKHHKYMKIAIDQAKAAGIVDEVPVGAVIVDENGKLIAGGHNRTIGCCDPTAHAEINAIRLASRNRKNYRLLSTTLYVTLEPCVMCMGAIVHARVKTIVFGAFDPKWGAAGSLYDIAQDPRLNHQVEVIGGVCADECRFLIQEFFRSRRNPEK